MFHREFVECNPTIPTYVHKLQEWRNKYESNIERKVRKSPLENASHWMVEFQYQKFDEIEVPGQYLKVTKLRLLFDDPDSSYAEQY